MTSPETVEKPERAWSFGRILAVAVAVALILFWIWIFSGGPRKTNPDFLKDRAWTEQAERTCARGVAQIGKLPGAETTKGYRERARVIDQATDYLENTVNILSRTSPNNRPDTALVKQWLSDYRTYIANRRDYARRLSTDPTARLLLDEKFNDGIDTVLGVFATVNNMTSCMVPGDVA